MKVLWEIMSFMLMITPLVFIHELGHFILAKIFKVKVNTFSIFMGKKLFRKKLGETEYCISSIPIGGYVSLTGEDPTKELPPEEEKRALYAQHPFKRFCIVAAGPIFNVLLTILLYIVIIGIGDPVTSNQIARVIPNSEASQLGLQAYDRIIKINQTPIKTYEDYLNALRNLADKQIKLEILRNNKVISLETHTNSVDTYDKFGAPIKAGEIDGIDVLPLNTVIAFNNPKSPAALAGLKIGDRIVSVNGKDVQLWHDLNVPIVNAINSNSYVNLLIERNNTHIPIKIAFNSHIKQIKELGLESAELYISSLLEAYPAKTTGLRKNDRLLAINKTKIYSFKNFYNAVQTQSSLNKNLRIKVIRQGKVLSFTINPKQVNEKDQLGNPVTHHYIGVVPYQNVYAQTLTEAHKIDSVTGVIAKAVEKTYDLTILMLTGLGKLLTGSVSPKQLSGPLMISKIASDILSTGIIFFLKLMALISLNLAIINLFPFPALDGGHIIILLVETIIRRKLPSKAIATISYLGFFVLMSLMVVITFNDIVRRFF